MKLVSVQESPQREIARITHRIEMMIYAILYISMVSCLAWSNYNFAIMLFCLYIWIRRKDVLALSFLMSLSVLMMFYDLTFLVVEMRLWVQEDSQNPSWQKIQNIFTVAIVCFALTNAIRILLLFHVKWAIDLISEQS